MLNAHGRLIFLFASLWAAPAFAGECPQFFPQNSLPIGDVVCKSSYAMAPSVDALIPLWSAEHLTPAIIAQAETAKRFGDFHVETDLPAGKQATNADYVGSGYDKGHMTPVGDFGTPQQESDTFSLANMVPQTKELNRFVWQDIEKTVREIAKQYPDTYVVTGPVVTGHEPRIKGRVAIPSETWKVVYVPGKIAGAYIATNTHDPVCQIVTISAVAALTLFNPMPGADEAGTSLPPPVRSRAGSNGCK